MLKIDENSEKPMTSPAHDEMSSIKQTLANQSNANLEDTKVQEVKQMRQVLSPPGCLEPDGSLNFRYFSEQVNEAWFKERDTPLLMKGILKHGVGKWSAIKSEFLYHHPVFVLKMQAKLLLGVRDLYEYQNQKLTPTEIHHIREDNIARAQAQGLLYNSMRYASLAQIRSAKKQTHIVQIEQPQYTESRETSRKRDKVKSKKSKIQVEKGCNTLENFFKKESPIFPNGEPEIEKKAKGCGKQSPESLSLTKTNSEENNCVSE